MSKRLACVAAVIAIAAAKPPLPKITKPVMWDTPEADRILAAMQIFPVDNAWNQDISKLPLHANSAAIIASIGADKPLEYNLDMNFVIVPKGLPEAGREDRRLSERVRPRPVADPRRRADRELAALEEREQPPRCRGRARR
jgi:hypothetical protein